jgi:hypothetical protein
MAMSKRVAIIVAVIAAFLIGATALFYFWLDSTGLINSQPPEIELERQAAFDQSLKNAQVVKGEIYRSNDETFQLRYPEDWFLTQLPPNSSSFDFGPMVESWRLTSFNPKLIVVGTLPDGGVRMDFQVFQNVDNLNWRELFCGEKKCQEITNNGIKYQSRVEELPSGEQVVKLMTQRGNRLYQITNYTIQGKEAKKALEDVQAVFETFVFLR